MSLLGFLTLRRYDLIVVDFDPFTFYLPLFNRARTVTEIYHLYGKHPIQKYGPLAWLVYWYEQFIPARCRNRVFISESVCRQIPPNGGRTQVIYTGIDDDLFAEQPEERNYVLTLGRVDIYNKGLDILIPAFQRLHAERPEVRLIIAGDGKDMPALQRMIREAGLEKVVETPGRVDAARKRELLRQSLFVVMPSRYEGWGIVAIEAAACGKATVGTNIDGLSDSIVDGQTGLLFAREDVADLHAKLRTLVTDAALRERLGRQGRERARLFLWDNIAVDTRRYFAAVLGKEAG
jgi:glycosyltransferase involved in cell wall biosynthesis